MARLSRPAAGFAATALSVLAFGIAFGYMEAAVVVYLRAALGALPGALPAHDASAFGTFEAVEVAREAGTLAMIVAVGALAGRGPLERLAWASVVFGTWDLAYYASLMVTIGWPPALDTWDVLFLIPMPWIGPVWAPLVVSAALVGFGLLAANRLRAGGRVLVTPVRILSALAGGGLVVGSFLVDTARLEAGDDAPWTGWPLFWTGMALAVTATAASLGAGALFRAVRARRVHDGSGLRPPTGSPG